MNSESAHGYRPCIIIPGIGQSRVIETDENGEKIPTRLIKSKSTAKSLNLILMKIKS